MPLDRLGPYRIEAELGSGGMGTVYRALDDRNRRVAVKVVHPHLLSVGGVFKRFLREAEVGKQVRHPNVVATLDVDAIEIDGKTAHFLVMEYVEGQTLRALLGEEGRLPEELCRHIGREVASALVGIHAQGVVHRDLKPENVLITPENSVKVMDLGLARLADEAMRLSRAGEFAGSVLYAAPEQFGGGDAVLDGRADLYAAGLLLYELGSGVHPFRDGDESDLVAVMQRQLRDVPPPPSDHNPQLSPFFDEVVRILLAKRPDERLPDAQTLLDVLQGGESGVWWLEQSGEIRARTHRPLRRIRIPRETLLYGRDRDLARVQAAFADAERGDGRVLLIEGEAGVGKTRLVDEAVTALQAAGRDLDFLFGSYPPGGAATAAGAFVTAYREHLGVDHLEERLADLLGEAGRNAPALAALLSGDAPPAGIEALSREAVQSTFVRLTRALAAERPLVVLVDDLHFAPEEGRSLFAALAAGLVDVPVLLVGTMRPGLPEAWVGELTRLPHVDLHPVQRLGPKDLHALLEEALGSRDLAEELGGRIAWKTDGNPFFVFEILQGLRAEGLLQQDDQGRWSSTSAIRDLSVPSSLRDLIRARVADLDEEDRSLLEMAACDGFEFDPQLVGAATGSEPIPLLRRLGRLEKNHRLVHSSGRRFVFDHHQVHETLYQGLNELLREEYHAALAGALERREAALEREAADLPGELAVAIGEHYLRGNRPAQARRYVIPALVHLGDAARNSAALELAELALEGRGGLDDTQRAEVLIYKARRLNILGQWDEERATLERARDLAAATGDVLNRSRALNFLGNMHVNLGQYREALAALEPALELARGEGDRVGEAFLAIILGNVEGYEGRWEKACDWFRRSIEEMRAIGEEGRELYPTINLGWALAALGRYEESLATFARTDTFPEDSRGERGNSIRACYRAALHRDLGDYDAAMRWAERGHDLALEAGYEWGVGTALHEQGAVHAERGDSERARTCLEAALMIRRGLGYRAGVAETLLAMGSARLEAPLLTEAHGIATEIGVPTTRLLASSYLALEGSRDAALARFDLDELRGGVRRRQLVEALWTLYRATRDAKLLDDARATLEEAVDAAPEEFRERIGHVPVYRAVRG